MTKQIAIMSINCNFHAKSLAEKVFGDSSCYYSGYDYHEAHASGRIPYIIGFHAQNRKNLEAQYCLIGCNPSAKAIYQPPAIIHWVGTDIMNAYTLFESDEKRMFEKLSHGAIIHLVHTQEHLDEMKAIMPRATYMIVPLPPYVMFEPEPFPEQKMISVYMPTERTDFFQQELIIAAAMRFPEVRFEFYYYYDRFEKDLLMKGTVNCFRVPARDAEGMKEQVRRSCAFLRVPVHDGLSVQALEFATAGRSVIYNKHLPFVDEVKLDKLDQEQQVEELCRHIKAALERSEPNQEMAAHYRAEFGHEKYVSRIADTVNMLRSLKGEQVVNG